ncbi:MAG: redoxin domain-containing protein [Mariprofundaceae bacterium]|nr:redoxin domain-containing protein [Mariprofundaceae bacterium]
MQHRVTYYRTLTLIFIFFGTITPLHAELNGGTGSPPMMRVVPEYSSSSTKKDLSFDDAQALKISQAAIGQTLEGFSLLDRKRGKVALEDYRGKPLVISFIYTACFHTCPIITQSLDRAAGVARDTFGEDSFQLLTIGFDARRDSPEKMRIFARQQGVAGEPGWEFLSADKKTIARLTERLGFIYFKSPRGFDHLAQTTVIDAEGVIRHQIYGENIESPQLVEPLKQLIFGGSDDDSVFSRLVSRAKLWCTVYDPRTDSYRFQYGMILGFSISILFLIGWGVFMIGMWKKHLRYRRSLSARVNSDESDPAKDGE